METGCTVSGRPSARRRSATLKRALKKGKVRLPSSLVPSGKSIRLSPAASRREIASR
jgi:hypothetical protein